MNMPRFSSTSVIVALALALAHFSMISSASGQQLAGATGKPVKVNRMLNRIELIANTSRLLEFEFDVPELVVDNQNIIRATPIASNQVLLTALKVGMAAITVNTADNKSQTIDIQVFGDSRGLELALQQVYPSSQIRAQALETGVVLSGTLSRAEDVSTVLEIASEYFPTVYNNLRLFNAQLVAIEVQIYEVARTKARQLGIDWDLVTDTFNLAARGGATSLGGAGTTMAFSVVQNGDTLRVFMDALERRNLAKLLDQPTLVTMNGRPAEFLSGGELPFQTATGFGNTTIEFRPFGTKLDVVPIVQGEGSVRLEVRAEVSEPSQDLASDNGTPGFRVRRVNTGVDMKMGHTLALAGHIREEIEATTSGIPWLVNTPYLGTFFRRVEENKAEIELIILLTPRFIAEVDPGMLPPARPGRNTVSPSDDQLYYKGYLEVPRCAPDCGPLATQPGEAVPYQFYSRNSADAVNSTISDTGRPQSQQFHSIGDTSTNRFAPAPPAASSVPTNVPQSGHPGAQYNWIQDPTQSGTVKPASPQGGFGFPEKPKSKKPSGGLLDRLSWKKSPWR